MFLLSLFIHLKVSTEVCKFLLSEFAKKWIKYSYFDKHKCKQFWFVIETCFCNRNFFLRGKLFFRHTLLFRQKLSCVRETCFYDRNLFLWQKLVSVTDTCFCNRNLFLWPKLVSATETSLYNTHVLTFHALFQGQSFYQIWEFLLSWIIEIITLWSPDGNHTC